MEPSRPPHPRQEDLQAYVLGKLDDDAADLIEKHLEECPECRRMAAEMPADTFLGRMRQAQPGGESETSDALSEEPGIEPASTIDSPNLAEAILPADAVATTAPARSNDADPKLGARVGYFGDYELLRVLGEGGMGIVYKARQISLNRPVALKMIKAARFATDDDRRRFQNEAEAVARLNHPNIVPIFEIGQFENQHYFSMKLIEGEGLDKTRSEFIADPRRSARLVAIAAGAIHHAHQRGILHRDLKPGNILIDPEGLPHVTDFGLAKRVEGDSELTRPEQSWVRRLTWRPNRPRASRGAVTISTDVYGLGAILFSLLTGKAPFGGTTVLDTLEQVRERPPESPRSSTQRFLAIWK